MSLFARARADQARTYKANDAARYTQIQAEKRAAAQKAAQKPQGEAVLDEKDSNAGVRIVVIGNKRYFDISKPVSDAVRSSKSEFKQHSGDLEWFAAMVGDRGKWNVKQSAKIWSSTLGVSEDSYGAALLFYGRVVTIDDIGNITYGYLGKAANISDTMLMVGSMGNHIKNHMFSDFDNEFRDEAYIQLGIDWYNGVNIQVRIDGQ